MATSAHKGNPVHTAGELPEVGQQAPDFQVTDNNLKDLSLSDYKGKRVIINIFPSIDTGVCATSVRQFNQLATKTNNTVILCVSKDLPFAHKRFCGAEGIENVVTASTFRGNSFAKGYGMEMIDGVLKGLMARSIVVVDPEGKVTHTELVDDITHEPNYAAALRA